MQPRNAIHRSGLTYTDKTMVITGGAKGIGEGCVRVFVDAGSRVAFLDIDANAGRKLEIELNDKRPGSCFFIEGNASKAADLQRFVTETVKRYETIDCLINNAGVHPPIKSIEEFTEEEFLETLKINTVGPFLAIKHALPYLKQSQGSIINIGSLVGQMGQEGASTYAASKGALDSLTKSLAIELSREGVRINNILPSNILTESRKQGVAGLEGGAEYWDRWIDSNQLHGKSGTPEDIGQFCLCLATKVLSFTQGACLPATYGAELGYGPKTPFTFLNHRTQNKRWDLVDKNGQHAENEDPNKTNIKSKL